VEGLLADAPADVPVDVLADVPVDVPLDLSLDDELFDGVSEPEPDDPELPVALGLSPATFFFLPVLKSVSYQPSPFRRKAAAETSLLSVGSSQIGQTFSGSSESF
jgi:hypothetical protein